MTTEALLKSYAGLIDKKIDILFPESSASYKSVIDAARYSFKNGGKRIRPAVLLEFYRLCGGMGEGAVNFAVALEMIHTYSLIHDDLPCMDNDDFRRGKPSCHKAFDEATALLAGDALLTNAFSVAASAQDIPAERVLEAIGVMSRLSGADGMIGGQVIDLENENSSAGIETVTQMYNLKTGALLTAAAQIGCILAGADAHTVENASEYAGRLGLAFQIIDDILDVSGDAALLGKPVGSDEKNGKTTYVTYYGVQKCRQIAAGLTDGALEALSRIDGDRESLIGITSFLLGRKY